MGVHCKLIWQLLLISSSVRMNSHSCKSFALMVVLVALTVDASYVSTTSHKKCHTEYDTVTSYEKQCSITYEEECNTVQEQQCSPKVEEVCNTVDFRSALSVT